MDVENTTDEILCLFFFCVKLSEWEGIRVVIDKKRKLFNRLFLVCMCLNTFGQSYIVTVLSNRDRIVL